MIPKAQPPELSLVMPCYNEEECLRQTAGELLAACAAADIALQLVLVDNGSRDSTGAVIDALIAAGQPVTKVVVEVNQGYGNGVLEGFRHCEAPLVGTVMADGQVAADDIVGIFRVAHAAPVPTLAKVRRRFREDSWRRRLVSVIYNLGMQAAFGWLGSIDLNGSPKIMPRAAMLAMELQSRDWFLDPEIMIKSKYLGLRVSERNVKGLMRQGGKSNVRYSTCLQFLKNIARYRFGGELRRWKNTVRQSSYWQQRRHTPAPAPPRSVQP